MDELYGRGVSMIQREEIAHKRSQIQCFNTMCRYFDEFYKRSCANPATVNNFNDVRTEGQVSFIEVCQAAVLAESPRKPSVPGQ